MNTCTRLWMTPTWATQSSGRTAAAAPSTSSPKTRRSWLSAGASVRATARLWPIRKWQELWETTAVLGRSSKYAANSPTSLTQTSCTGSALHMCPCTCPVTLHRRRPTPSSTIRPSRATAALRQQTGTAGTLTISRTKITTWPQASPHTPNSEVAESSQDVKVFKDSNIFVTCWILVVKCINLQKTYKNVFLFSFLLFFLFQYLYWTTYTFSGSCNQYCVDYLAYCLLTRLTSRQQQQKLRVKLTSQSQIKVVFLRGFLSGSLFIQSMSLFENLGQKK